MDLPPTMYICVHRVDAKCESFNSLDDSIFSVSLLLFKLSQAHKVNIYDLIFVCSQLGLYLKEKHNLFVVLLQKNHPDAVESRSELASK